MEITEDVIDVLAEIRDELHRIGNCLEEALDRDTAAARGTSSEEDAAQLRGEERRGA